MKDYAQRLRIVLLSGLLVVGGGVVITATAGQQAELEAYYERAETLQGLFEQWTIDERDRIIDQASGEFVIERPARFRWSYAEPFAQEIVADGERLWVYEVDLDQVTVRDQHAALGSAPAQLLSGDYAALTAAFEIIEKEQFVRLVPKEAGQAFDEARLGLRDGRPFALEIDDALGQTTRVELLEVRVNESVDEAKLRFEPPAGVDVYKAD
ncbi:outer membrane lipoprotein carrier protein LolA [Halorhodospira abdelmalekii]|uniref:outer membrane lipoprotein chaperone LolA n=1 Tax=Halorhodospira abdelmalekii TaxID=421629 RepID=UPI001902C8B4|nr:outer membrane lipoprotein chaperone LolA [Halorhodospira abdelmalekii]MBK1733936.1 outer membrane lipoprotein carrier protein LolA [Halorhodospira abdelmalekii]